MRQTAGRALMRNEWRALGRLLLESALTGAFVSVVLALAVFIAATQAQAAASEVVSHGTLLLRDDAGQVAAPLVFTDVKIDISGMTARVRVAQRFVNPTGEWREGVYVFPLPENAAVDHLDLRIGERVVEGQIRERHEARRTYEAAKAEGRKTALVEQERPNLFTTSVAHIGPGEEVVVAIEYQQTLAYDGGSFALRFPLAITPRYVPGAPAGGPGEGDGGGVARNALRVPAGEVTDADRIAPPVADPVAGAINPVAIGIELNAGFPLAHLASRHHAVRIEERPGHRYALALAQGVVPAARDFELTWAPDVGEAPGAALLTEQRDGRRFALLMVLPPAVDPTSVRPPREITYIVDTSGSMEGVSIEQAKEALLLALDRLRPGDRFNVIEFNSTTRSLHDAPMPVDMHTVAAARAFVRGLRARGGTEMLPALTAALATPRGGPHLRQIVFLTDGAVGNEDQLLRLIEQRLDGRRLFTIGIGPAPNAFFMKKAAEAGRGTFTFIGDAREVKERMGALLRKIESPVLTDIDVRWPGAVVAYPGRVRDLYAGEPVVLTAELAPGVRGDVMLAGEREGRPWRATLPLDAPEHEPGIGVLWARERIEALLDAKRSGAPADEVRREVVATALAFHLVSAYTSLVAVDVTPTKPAGVDAIRTALAVNLPEGLTFGAIGGVPQTATPAPLLMLAGMVALLLALVLHLAHRRGGQRRTVAATDSRAVAAARCVC